MLAGIGLGLLGGLVGAWWGARQADVHQATAVILLNPTQGNPFSPDARGDDLVNLETEAQLVTSDAVLGDLGAALPGDADVEAAQVSVTVPANTQLLSITVSGASDARAEEASQALATTYLSYRGKRTTAALADQRAHIHEQIGERSRERARLAASLDEAAPGSPGSTLLTQQILATVTQIAELRSRLGEIGGTSLDPGQVVTPAHVDGRGPLPPGPWAPAALAALVGVVGGCVLVGQLARATDVVRSREDVADLDVPLWGDLPSEPTLRTAAVARLRAVLLARHPTAPTTVLVCRAGPPAGADAGTELARAMAASRLRTVVVDLVAPDPDPHDGPVPGLTDVLRDEVAIASAVSWAGHLGHLPVGADEPALDDLVASTGMSVLLGRLHEDCDAVVLRGGASSSPRTLALAAVADLAVVEVAVGRGRRSGIEDAVTELTGAGSHAVGLVLVTPGARRTRRGHVAALRARRHQTAESARRRVRRVASAVRTSAVRASRSLARQAGGGGARD